MYCQLLAFDDILVCLNIDPEIFSQVNRRERLSRMSTESLAAWANTGLTESQ